MTDQQYKNILHHFDELSANRMMDLEYIIDEILELKKNQISPETMKTIVEMLKDITMFLREQAKVFDRVQDYLDEEDHQIQKPEPMVS